MKFTTIIKLVIIAAILLGIYVIYSDSQIRSQANEFAQKLVNQVVHEVQAIVAQIKSGVKLK